MIKKSLVSDYVLIMIPEITIWVNTRTTMPDTKSQQPSSIRYINIIHEQTMAANQSNTQNHRESGEMISIYSQSIFMIFFQALFSSDGAYQSKNVIEN